MQVPSLIKHSASTPPGEVCAACGRVIGELEQPYIWEETVVCFGCHRDLSQSPVGIKPADGAAERVFLNDSRVQITRTHVVFDRTAYNVADIRFVRLLRTAPRRIPDAVLIVAGLSASIVGLNRQLDRLDLGLLVLGAALFVAGITTTILRRSKYSVLLTINDIEHRVFTTTHSKYAHQIVDAVGEAVIERGQFVAVVPPPTATRAPLPAATKLREGLHV